MQDNNTPIAPKLTPRRLKARKLAETVIEVVVNEGGTLEDVANRIPSLADNEYKRQSVYNSVQRESVQSEMKAIASEFDLKAFAAMTKRKLNAIVANTPEDKPSAPQAALMTVGLKLSGDLVEKRENVNTQQIDLESVRALSKGDKAALLMELIRLESAGMDVSHISESPIESGGECESPTDAIVATLNETSTAK